MSLTYSESQQHNAFQTPWSAERDEALKRLWAQGYSAALIADKLANGVRLTRCAVIGRAHRLKLPARRDKQPLERKPYRANGKAPKPPRWKPQPLSPSPQPSRPRAPAPTPPTEPAMRRLRLAWLEPHQCHWPLGSLYEVAHLFCAADTHAGAVYCPHHMSKAYPRGKQQ
jgi:GcrA cell cycle regulator